MEAELWKFFLVNNLNIPKGFTLEKSPNPLPAFDTLGPTPNFIPGRPEPVSWPVCKSMSALLLDFAFKCNKAFGFVFKPKFPIPTLPCASILSKGILSL